MPAKGEPPGLPTRIRDLGVALADPHVEPDPERRARAGRPGRARCSGRSGSPAAPGREPRQRAAEGRRARRRRIRRQGWRCACNRACEGRGRCTRRHDRPRRQEGRRHHQPAAVRAGDGVRAPQDEREGLVLARRRRPPGARARHRPADRQALHLRRQGQDREGFCVFSTENHRRRGLPGVPVDSRAERPHRRSARPLPQDHRDPRRRGAGHPDLRTGAGRSERRALRHPSPPPQERVGGRRRQRARQVQVEGWRHRRLRPRQHADHHRHRLEHPPDDRPARADRRR